MRTRVVVLAGFLASAIGFPMIRVEAAPALHPDDIGIRLVGCLVKSDDGYLLINLPSEPSTGTMVTGAVGTSGVSSTIVYWLEDDDELKHQVGHRVEVVGSVKGEPKNAKIRLRRYYAWTEMKVKAGGHTLQAMVPSVVPAPNGDNYDEVSAVVRKVDVDHVFMVSVGCN